ncbi:MAG TPA: hypothetical protein VGN06_04315 [Gaiellaceae bacterium]
MSTRGNTLPLRRPVGATRTPGVFTRWLEQDGLTVTVIALDAVLLAAFAAGMLVQDSWLSFVDGRLVARHWLPHVDTLTRWTLGRSWIDQQWAAHLLLYEVVAHAGLVVALALGVVCVVSALVIVAVAARKLGASSPRTAVAMLVPLVAAPWMTQLRAQSLALPLFAGVYALLVLDARRPGRRVLWTIPLLVIWANVHGSVALGAGLVALRGVELLLRRTAPVRGLALVVCAPLAMVASPYGFRLVAYYRLMLFHPPLASFVQEWHPAYVSIVTAGFFLAAFLVCAAWGAHPRAITAFEAVALAVLLVSGLLAVRNAVWFAFAAAVALSRLLDAVWPTRIDDSPSIRRMNRLVATVALVAVAVLSAVQAVRLPAALHRAFPPSAAAAVASAAGRDGVVLADDAHADWLLWEQPSLAGRIAYDVRFELFDRSELEELTLLRAGSHPIWRSCGSTASVVTFPNAAAELPLSREGVLAPGSRTLVRIPGFVAIRQPVRRTAARCAL